MHAHCSASLWQHDATRNVDAATLEFFKHESPRGIVSKYAHKGDAKAKARRATGHDCRRATNRQKAAFDHIASLTEGNLVCDIAENKVRHGVPSD
jgi:hypothetical protein